MTKAELKYKVDYYYKKYMEFQKQLEKMDKAFEIYDMEKPFKDYTIAEMQLLTDISEKAYEWSRENPNSNIYDYNTSANTNEKIALGK